jgi:hypothetical protein
VGPGLRYQDAFLPERDAGGNEGAAAAGTGISRVKPAPPADVFHEATAEVLQLFDSEEGGDPGGQGAGEPPKGQALDFPRVRPSEGPSADSILDPRLRSGRPRRRRRLAIAAGTIVLAVILLAGGNAWRARSTAGVRPAADPRGRPSGTVALRSNPSGLAVAVRGSVRGTTPLNLTLPVGEHDIDIGAGPEKRTVRVRIFAGSYHAHFLDLASAADAPAHGDASW